MPARIYLGTSSWSEASLVASGRFYPDDIADSDGRLAFYAQRFDMTEVDSTYYAFISRKKTEHWATIVPDDFRFNIKGFALFTQHPARLTSIPKSFHERLPDELREKARVYYKDVPEDIRDELWQIFRNALRPLREAAKLGPVLIDFPPWFVPSTANRDYLRHVRERLPGEPVVIEFRNALWLADDATTGSTLGLLRELGFGFVAVDEPQGLKTSFPPVAAATSPVSYVRFRGRNAARWDDKSASTEEKLDWWYTDEQLAEWLPRIEQLARDSDEVYLTFNTKAEDQGVQNALRLQRLLGLASSTAD